MPEKPGSVVGVAFTETMRGYMALAPQSSHAMAEIEGRLQGQRLEFTVTAAFPDVGAMIAASAGIGRLDGTVTAPALGPAPFQVEGGVFHLFERDPAHPQTLLMRYRMPMRGNGRELVLHGRKTIRDDLGLDMWSDTTTLDTDIETPSGEPVARGIVHISAHDFARQLTTMKAIGAAGPTEALWAVTQFGTFFEERLRQVYGGAFGQSEVAPAFRPTRALRCGTGERYPVRTADGVELRLTRFQGGTKGPVLLTPGFGTSTLAYLVDTVETNLPEFLFERGYDVWLLDYRSSPDLPSAATQFTLDDIARHDYPAAVGFVRQHTGAADIQVMAHCVGSLTLEMALALGLTGVRSAICSQLTLHPRPPLLNRIKSGLYLADLLHGASVDTMSTDFRGNWFEEVFDAVLRLYPSNYQRSASPVVRRILFMYGDVIKLENLNRATYEAIPAMFGVANLSTFVHLGRIMRTGHAVAADGAEAYLPHADRLALPILFLHGAENGLFLPEGSTETMAVLAARNGGHWYSRQVVPGYAHMDCFIGKDAARDVYPLVAAELDRHNPAAGPGGDR